MFGSLRCLLESHVKLIFKLHPSIALLGTLLEILDVYHRQFLELMRWFKGNLYMEVRKKQVSMAMEVTLLMSPAMLMLMLNQ